LSIRTYRQGVSIYVIGTDSVQEALAAAGITPETHRWTGTAYGLFARRQGYWRECIRDHPPKDAKPGVCFVGPIQAREEADR